MDNQSQTTGTDVPDGFKLCKGKNGCGKVKPLADFANDKSKKDGKRINCRQCIREYNKAHIIERRIRDKEYRNRPENRYKKYKRSAEIRGFIWGLSRDEFMKFWKKPCVHCGSSIETIGLDRIDPKKPYEIGNVEPCCWKCNQMKSDYTTDDWYAHMRKVLDYQKD